MALTARVFDASDNLVADGLLDKIINFTFVERLDQIGSFTLALPLAAERSKKYIDQGSVVAVADDHKEIFRGVIDSAKRNGAQYVVSGSDLLEELRYPEVGLNYAINGVSLADAVDDIVALAPNWTAITSSQSVKVASTFKGKSVFDALRELQTQYGLHMRRTSTTARTVNVAPLGATTGYTLTNPPLLTMGAQRRNTAAIIGSPGTDVDRTQIINRVVAIGGTYSSTVLVLPLANRVETTTIVNSRTRNGQIEHYIEDSASVAMYGAREKVVGFGDITPASSDAGDVARAGDALKQRAVAFLTRYANPLTTHTIQSKTFDREAVRVGDLLTVDFEETAGDNVTISINDDFYLTEIGTRYDMGGAVQYELVVSDVNRVRLDDREALVATMRQLEAKRLEDL